MPLAASRAVAGAFIAVVAIISPASAAFMTYAIWVAQTPFFKSAYIAGAYDSLVTFAADTEGQRVATHYSVCLQNAQMTNRQLAENVERYASARPALQAGTVQKAMIDYLIEACGPP